MVTAGKRVVRTLKRLHIVYQPFIIPTLPKTELLKKENRIGALSDTIFILLYVLITALKTH